MTDDSNPWSRWLDGGQGEEYWRGLEELMATREFREAVEREFPAGAAEIPGPLSRRTFVKLIGAQIALAGLTGCFEPPADEIIPYVEQPPELTPGVPRYYATSMVLDGYATGLLVESHGGRPTRVEGNPEHPASLGAAGVFEQASVLQLYDPHRTRAPTRRGRSASWSDFRAFLDEGESGAAIHVLLGPTSSPSLERLIGRVRESYPQAVFEYYAPLWTVGGQEASRSLFGRPLQTQHDFSAAKVILSLDADFLAGMAFHLRYARGFAERRRLEHPGGEMNRLYAVEPRLSVTGAAADHHLAVTHSEVRELALAVLAEVVGAEEGASAIPEAARAALRAPFADRHREWVRAAAEDLHRARGESIVIAGATQPPEVHTVVGLINAALGNLGTTVWHTEPTVLEAGSVTNGLASLAERLRAGAVDTLIILNGNPSYSAAPELEIPRLISGLERSAYLGLYRNETAEDCTWHVPGLHYLEEWGDGRAYDGTSSLIQPLVAPLFDGKGEGELLAMLVGDTSGPLSRLREYWRGELAGPDFEVRWRRALQRGLIEGSESPRVPATPDWGALLPIVRMPASAEGREAGETMEIALVPDPSVYDGRFANNAWLQELPDPLTKLTWGNAALLSPTTATKLEVETGDILALSSGGRPVHAPAFVLPGHADDAISLPVGYGRQGVEGVGRGVGFNAFLLTRPREPFVYQGRVERLMENGDVVHHPLATTQTHWRMHGRPIVLHKTLEEYRKDPDFTKKYRGEVASIYEPWKYEGVQWGMTIDLNTCIGCNACVVACQAENNVPVVGKEGVMNSREMHWLRIDRYFHGAPEDPDVLMQPMLCQHCERAPCEYVCPVNATVHSADGLNEMIYNRCVGTRFCSNNCPYKVRRFNWFDYNADRQEIEEMYANPDVTVRARGVMEKCTYCVQRIRRAQIDARVEGREVEDGEVVTACQQACPTQAIVFGAISDPDSRVSKLRENPRRYAVMHELGTKPRTEYLARIRNPNPALAGGSS
jgi:molybdopterin-containing oxidoreductase family iron-sulfur binding subunit